MYGYYEYYVPTPEEIAEELRILNEKKAALEKKIKKEEEELTAWLDNPLNKHKVHYKLVEEIDKYFKQEDKEHGDELSLLFYQDKLDNMHAVNQAISTNNTSQLVERVEACRESRSFAMQLVGVLMLSLAVILAVVGIATLNSVIVGLSILTAYAGGAFLLTGSEKVSTNKSTLFSDLKEKISPSPLMPLMSMEEERLIYALHC